MPVTGKLRQVTVVVALETGRGIGQPGGRDLVRD